MAPLEGHWAQIGVDPLCGHPETVVSVQMTTRRYAPEYRRQMVELVRTGRTAEELSREFECSAQAIRNWVRQADLDEGRRSDGLTTVERDELRRLRREHLQLREEREIQKRAAAWFARETDTVLLRDAGVRTDRAQRVPHAGRSAPGRIRFRRGLLQPQASSLGLGLPQPSGPRAGAAEAAAA